MREIKFRAWDGCNMLHPEELEVINPATGRVMHDVDAACGDPECCTSSGPDWEDIAWPVMQYTGLKDKNGKEIYEGDLIHLPAWNPNIVEIVFNRGAFCFRFASSDAFYHDIKYVEDAKVIGNIYENPELLK